MNDEHDAYDHESHNAGLSLLITCLLDLQHLLVVLLYFVLIKKQYVIPISLSFAAGVIIYLSFMSLLPASIEQFDLYTEKKMKHWLFLCHIMCCIWVFV